jgi:leader peptidase (prepilin peptidase) / N-methyltransferase
MDWVSVLPMAFWTLWVFALGLSAGSFLNVVCGRLPLEKSVMWPNSRCLSCLRRLSAADNLPVIGYLRRRGRCGHCGSKFSSRYMWIELFCGLAYVAVFWIEIVPQTAFGPEFVRPWKTVPGIAFPFFGVPTVPAWVYFGACTTLVWLLMAAAIIDAEYRIIPTLITYPGTVLGLVISTVLPWPWPSATWALPEGAVGWGDIRLTQIPSGIALWPAWEPPGWAPAGSWQLGLLTGLAGAAAGMFVIRALKWAFEWGFGQEAVGLGDADLLMMAGAFVGWQPVVLAVPVGAVVTLLALPLLYLKSKLTKKPFDPAIPFGPGLAVGVIVVWLCWPFFGELSRSFFFEPVVIGFVTVGGYGCLLVAGLLLRRGEKPA